MEQFWGLCLVQQIVCKNQFRGGSKKSEKTYAQNMYLKDTGLQLNCHKWSFSFIPGLTSFSSRNYINLLDAKSNDSKVELISYVAETSEVLTNIKK